MRLGISKLHCRQHASLCYPSVPEQEHKEQWEMDGVAVQSQHTKEENCVCFQFLTWARPHLNNTGSALGT